MKHHAIPARGALALACVLPFAAFAQSADPAADLLTGTVAKACEAILCLSSSLRPGECAPSLSHYFGIEIFKKGSLDWSATVDARRAFLGMCPVGGDEGMPARLDAISKGAGKCDAAYLNKAYAATAYRYRERSRRWDSNTQEYVTTYEVQPIKTVSLNKLPSYCVAYNDHAWTYELSIKYVGEPLKGGYWIKAEDYEAAQAKWSANYGGSWAAGWQFSMQDPHEQSEYYSGR